MEIRLVKYLLRYAIQDVKINHTFQLGNDIKLSCVVNNVVFLIALIHVKEKLIGWILANDAVKQVTMHQLEIEPLRLLSESDYHFSCFPYLKDIVYNISKRSFKVQINKIARILLSDN